MAGALARRDISDAIRLLELEKHRGFNNVNQLFLLIYLYCLNNDVNRAEQLAAADVKSIQRIGSPTGHGAHCRLSSVFARRSEVRIVNLRALAIESANPSAISFLA